jgi:hypothetical protein
MQRYPESGAVRESNNFLFFYVYVISPWIPPILSGRPPINYAYFNLNAFNYLETFKLLGLNYFKTNPNLINH